MSPTLNDVSVSTSKHGPTIDQALCERALQHSQAAADQSSRAWPAGMMFKSEREHAVHGSEAGSVDDETASTATPTFNDLLSFCQIPGSVTSTPVGTPRELLTHPSGVHEIDDDSDGEYCMPLTLKNTFLYASVLPSGYRPRRTQSCPPRMCDVSTPFGNEAMALSKELPSDTKRKRKKRPVKASGGITQQLEIKDVLPAEVAIQNDVDEPKARTPSLSPAPSSRDVSVRRAGKKQPKLIESRRQASKAVLSTEMLVRTMRGVGWPACASLIMLCIVFLGPLFTAQLAETDRFHRELASERQTLTKRLKELDQKLARMDIMKNEGDVVLGDNSLIDRSLSAQTPLRP